MNTVEFNQIVDSRFSKDIESDFNILKKNVISALESLSGIEFKFFNERTLNWDDGDVQKRITFQVRKGNSKPSWDDVYEAVNKVKPVKYTFV